MYLVAFAALLAVILSSCSHSKKLSSNQRNDLKSTYEALKRDMTEARVTLEGDKVKVVLPEAVLFRINSAEINKDYLPILAKMATILNRYNQTDVLVTGYTDATGTDSYNIDLSRKRAESAKNVLLANEVNAARLHVWGLGAANPVADNATDEGRKQNRRVEYVIMFDYKEEKK